MAAKIPSAISRFRGDNTQDFVLWIKRFQAHCDAVDVRAANELPTLLCCLEGTAFSIVSEKLVQNDDMEYDGVVALLKQRFCGKDYRRKLQVKLQSMRFTRGTNINVFVNELLITIKGLYNLDGNLDEEAVKSIALNHITSNLDDELRGDAKMFQLGGNESLEHLLEFLELKMSKQSLPIETSASSFEKATKTENTRLDKLEQMMERVLTRLNKDESKPMRPTCEFCRKPGHDEERCFKKKTCRKCKKMGHIAKFCKEPAETASVSSSCDNSTASIEPAKRTLITLQIGKQDFDFLYDTGSQFSIMKRENYDKLLQKPPLQNVDKIGTGIDGSQFKFDGVAYLNLTFVTENGSPFILEYEPVLISQQVTCNIFGATTENRFSSCERNLTKSEIVYTVNDIRVPLKAYKEKISPTSAYIAIAKASHLFADETKSIKGKVIFENKAIHLGDNELFEIVNTAINENHLSVTNFAIDKLNKTILLNVRNTGIKNLKLKKGDVLADVNIIEQINENDISVNVVSDAEAFNIAKLNMDGLSGIETERLQSILNNYFESIKLAKVNESKIPYEHSINLKDDEPVVSKPRVLPEAFREEVYNQIDKLLDEGVIEISDSPYASPVVPVVKKDKSIRLAIDYRKINSKIIPKSYPIARSEELMLDLREAEVFTVLDLKSAYWHIPIKHEDQHKTAFVVPNAKYQWTVLPFGLTDAAFSLAYVMTEVLREFKFAKSFYDDCILAGKRSEHLGQIEKVLNKFADFGIHVNLSKCQLFKEEVTFVGHLVNKNGIRAEHAKSLDIVNFPRPQSAKDMKSFLGVASYLRKFISDFSEKSAVLYSLLKKGAKFTWTRECEEAFELIKQDLVNPSSLRHPDFSKPFILTTDASDKALGFSLMQNLDGNLFPIMFGGRIISDTEKRYCTTDKELLAVYYAVKRCEYYLMGHSFLVYTDHKPLIHLKAFREIINKRFRWIEYLESLNTHIRYIPGKDNILSDFISRNIKTEDKLQIIDACLLELHFVSYSEDDLLAKQLNDDEISKCIDNLKDSNTVIPNIYKRYKSKLVIQDNFLKFNQHGKLLYVCPKELQEEILRQGHDPFWSGHFAVFKTHRRILESTWWPNILQEVKNYINNCKICILSNNPIKKSILGKRNFPKKNNELISIDFIVDLPVTERNNVHIMTIVDNCTKYVKCYAVKDRTALTASRCIYDYVMLFGIPEKVYSDRDPSYEAKLFKHLMNTLGVQKLRTTGYNPKGNGLCEKSNGIVKQYLQKYVNLFVGEWDQYLNELSYAYNTSIHSSTGFSPAELTFGRKLRVPLDILYGWKSQNNLPFNVKDFKDRLHRMYELANESMDARQEKYLSYHDKKVYDDMLEAETLVYMYLPRKQRAKLALKWKGPCKVIASKHPVYHIEYMEKERTNRKWITREKLRRCENSATYQGISRESTQESRQQKPQETEIDIFQQIEERRISNTRNDRNNGNGSRYNLRRNVAIPERYGAYVTHD